MTSVLELSAVSNESCTALMMKPTPTTCMDTSYGMPNSAQASGTSSRLPDGTPLAPAAPSAETTHSSTALPADSSMPSVFAAASASTLMVMAAPAMLTV